MNGELCVVGLVAHNKLEDLEELLERVYTCLFYFFFILTLCSCHSKMYLLVFVLLLFYYKNH